MQGVVFVECIGCCADKQLKTLSNTSSIHGDSCSEPYVIACSKLGISATVQLSLLNLRNAGS